MELREKVKEYLRIDGNQDDEMLELLVKSAKEYMENAGVKEQSSDLYRLGIMMLVTHWFENREQISGTVPHTLAMGLQSIILQLKSW